MTVTTHRGGAQPASSAPFRVRAARRGDAEAIRQLLAELGFPDAADAQTVHWIISHPEMEIYVACDSHDKPIGMLSLSHRPQLRMKGRIATIDELVVTSAWRKKGVGKELLRHALQRAKVLSVKRVELVNKSGRADSAQGFYQACGLSEADAVVFRVPELERK
ncbi:MAG: GNAT family N-acetyltransferase [Myxococcota bacterium]